MEIHPKKHLGQHFLKDENIARKIISSLTATDGNVLEVGPGRGVLTKYLFNNNDWNTRVIEIDEEAISFLRQVYPDKEKHIIKGDFLRYELLHLFEGPFSVIGNFPYNISSQILFRILEYRDKIPEVVCMLQKEVAVRLASGPGNKDYGILSVLLQAYYDINLLFTVSEHVFQPPPKVKSAVISLHRNSTTHLDCDELSFFKLVKTAFNQRRKTLRNALHIFTFHPSEKTTLLLTKRAEQLSVEDFVFLTNAVKVEG